MKLCDAFVYQLLGCLIALGAASQSALKEECKSTEQEGEVHSLLQQHGKWSEIFPPHHPEHAFGDMKDGYVTPPEIDFEAALGSDVPEQVMQAKRSLDTGLPWPESPVLLLTSYWVHDTQDSDWWGSGDIYAYITMDNGKSSYTPVQHEQNSGNLYYALQVPYGRDVEVAIYDDDSSFDDLIFTFKPDMRKPSPHVFRAQEAGMYHLDFYVLPSASAAAWEMWKQGMCPNRRCKIHHP